MTIRVTITKPNVFDAFGLPMVVGTTYPVDDAFGLSLIQSLKASDTDGSLTDPGVGKGAPPDIVYVNAATLAAPTAQMLASLQTVFALDVAPYTQYRSTGETLIPLSNAQRVARWAPCTNRTTLPNVFNPAVTVNQNRVGMVMMVDADYICFEYWNGYVDNVTFADTGTGGVMSINSAMEYSDGTIAQIQFAGQPTGVLQSNERRRSDPLPAPRKGATFYERPFQSNQAGIVLQGGGGGALTPVRPGDGNRNTGATDQSMGGTIQAAAGSIFGAVAIVAYHSEPAAGIPSDSMGYGSQDTGDATMACGYFPRALSAASIPFLQLGVSGDQLQYFADPEKSAVRSALIRDYDCTVVLTNYGTNDLVIGSRTAAQMAADLVTIRNMFPDIPFYAATLTPRVTSTDQCTTVASQTVLASYSQQRRYNNLLRQNGVPLLTGFIEVALLVESEFNAAGTFVVQSGLWGNLGVQRTTAGDGTISSGSNSYSSASAAFTASDTGGLIQIAGAGSAGASLLGVMTFVNSTTVTLTDLVTGAARNAGTTVTTANAQIGVMPFGIDGTHPTRFGYRWLADKLRSISALVN